jgi:hypothetical protein
MPPSTTAPLDTTFRDPAGWFGRLGALATGRRRLPLQGGCCGLAGSGGFQQGKYQISMDCGEQALLPRLRQAGTESVVVAHGFFCKTQIEEPDVGRPALHLAEVMRLARHGEPLNGGSPTGHPGDRRPDSRPAPGRGRRLRRAAIPVAGGLLAAARWPAGERLAVVDPLRGAAGGWATLPSTGGRR